jgi:hypothetical protein
MALKPNQQQGKNCHLLVNVIIERVYKVLNGMHRSFDLENNHENLDEGNPFDCLFQIFTQLHGFQAIRSTYHRTLQTTSDIFGRDMI